MSLLEPNASSREYLVDDDGYEYRPPVTPWTVYFGFALLVLAVVGAVLFAMAPSPYVVERPGPAFDTLGNVENSDGDEIPLIDIPDETTYPTSGELNLLTVYIDGSRERALTWLEVAQAWFDPSRSVLPIDAVYPDGQTDEEADEQSAADMSNSQQDAVAAALTASLGSAGIASAGSAD